MDNRRVMKLYRDRNGRQPSSGGLFSRVKRYFSGPQPQPQTQPKTSPEPPKKRNFTSASVPLHSNTLLADLSKSVLLSSGTRTVTENEDSNRILSEFFHEKGGKPLSEIEYEGVMSLLERSKASITLPLPDLSPRKPNVETAECKNGSTDANASRKALNTSAMHNNTFVPYSQTKLRNTSMYLNNSSFAASEYKPVYHTFNESTSSRANVSMKRVYQFSGLPSPYQTRIKTPNLAARKLRRITPWGNDTETSAVASTNTTAAEISAASSSFRPKSKTANALLSVLDGDSNAAEELSNQQPTTKDSSLSKPLHNPYFRPKRRPISKPSTSVLTANDISKTVLHSKAGAHEDLTNETLSKLFENVEGPEATKNKDNVKEKRFAEPLIGTKEDKPISTFSFGTKLPAETQTNLSNTVPTFSFLSKDLDSPVTAFTFSKPEANSMKNDTSDDGPKNEQEDTIQKTKSKGFGFTFSSEKPKETPATQEKPLFGFPQASKPSQDLDKASQDLEVENPSEKEPITFPGSSSSTVFQAPHKEKPAASFGNNGPLFGASKPIVDTFGASTGNEIKTKEGEKKFSLFSTAQTKKDVVSSQQPKVDDNKQINRLGFGANFSDSKIDGGKNMPFSFGAPVAAPSFSFGQSTTENEEKSKDSSFGTKTANVPFQFGNGNVPAQVNGTVASEFTFPEVIPRAAHLKEERVKHYESLFEF